MQTGNGDTRLIVIRGNSGSGKSCLAAAIRKAKPRGIAVVGQDQLRREVLRVRDHPGNPAVGYIDLSARYALDLGMHVIVEGTLFSEIYGDMLRQLFTNHRGITRCYRYELSFEETLCRHSTKSVANEFGEADMRTWWRQTDPISGIDEKILRADLTLSETVNEVLGDCGC